jgi:glycosyltransferase involved in cell wall biosynthesis
VLDNNSFIGSHKPSVSIGMPVFNAEKTLERAINSLLNQTYLNFELLISDNCSSDSTQSICSYFASKDRRIKYVRHPFNMGPSENFKYVFTHSKCEYFMWAAADDIRSENFIENNLTFLLNNQDYSFASFANFFEGEEDAMEKFYAFSLEGNIASRFSSFLGICWSSHACFYSLFKRSALLDYNNLSETYLASDWSIIIHLLLKGSFKRVDGGVLILGKGISSTSDFVNKMRKNKIDFIFPLYDFSIRFVSTIVKQKELSFTEKASLIFELVKLNLFFLMNRYKVRILKLTRFIEQLLNFSKKLSVVFF